jgi:hypothetical protein
MLKEKKRKKTNSPCHMLIEARITCQMPKTVHYVFQHKL